MRGRIGKLDKITTSDLEKSGFLLGIGMDDQIKALSDEIKAVEGRISSKIDDLDKSVRHLQIAEGTKEAVEYRLKKAEEGLEILFARQRKAEEKYEERFTTLNMQVSTKVAYWKGIAGLATVGSGVIVVMIDIALNLYK